MKAPNNDEAWNKRASYILKAELAKRGLSYMDLQEKLNKAGIDIKLTNIRVKINRGTFASAFLLQCLHVIGVKSLNLADYYTPEDEHQT